MRKRTETKKARRRGSARSDMQPPTERRGGKTFVIIPQSDYRRLVDAAAQRVESMPALPPEAADGTMPALEFARASIARGIIRDRRGLAWSQAELARRAGIRVETLNRIERAKVTPDAATLNKIDAAIRRGRRSGTRAAAAG
jgi:DNA-binding XRE family transcriptional regulator